MTGATPAKGAEFILTVSCPDRPGLVYAVSAYIVANSGNIVDSQQFGDAENGLFFIRLVFVVSAETTADALRVAFAPVAKTYEMDWQLHDARKPTRTLLMASREGHCLNDLLFRYRAGSLNIDDPVVVSNHPDLEPVAASYGVAFYHLPVPAGGTGEQEQSILALAAEHGVELVVLARYMQILSAGFCAAYAGRLINIHHSFLPAFSGARPYFQAHRRGVKLIGATAHYVTPTLDEGPIIEQDVERVDHAMTVARLAAVGRDVECRVLAKAVSYQVEHRVFVNGERTVVFR